MKAPTFAHATTSFLGPEGEFLLLLTADNPERCGTVDWFVEHRENILQALDHYGVVYFRGFKPDSHLFEAFVDVVAPGTMPLMGGVSPRRFVHGTVHTANDAPGGLTVVQHHELSYHGCTPRYVAFYCDRPPPSGGATPISDGRLYGRTMDERFRGVMDDLEEKGVVFIRNYAPGNVKSWAVTWQTSDREELERRMRTNSTEWDWISDDWLQTRQRRRAIVRDPVTGQRILYASINIWQRGFVKDYNLVYHVADQTDDRLWELGSTFGDGSPIPREFILAMDEIYNEQKIVIPYEPQDFMFINNFIATHGRTPYVGTPDERRVFVTMREPIHFSEMGRLPARRGARRP